MRQIVSLLLACLACGKQPELPMDGRPNPSIPQPTVSLPHAEASAPNQLGKDTIQITLTRDGRVAYQGRWVTLDQLGKEIKVEWPAGRDQNVLLRCDRAAPWLHAMWLLQVCAESNLWRTHFAVREDRATPEANRNSPRVVECFLPVDVGLCISTATPKPALVVPARVWGKQGLWMFQAGDGRPRDLEGFDEQLRNLVHDTRPDWKVGPIAEIEASSNAPVEAVVAMIGAFRKHGSPAVRFLLMRGQSQLRERDVMPLPPIRRDSARDRSLKWSIVDSYVEDGVLYYEEEEEPLDD